MDFEYFGDILHLYGSSIIENRTVLFGCQYYSLDLQ